VTTLAKVYIAVMASLATAVLAIVVVRWSATNISFFALFFTLALVASAMKIRLPGLKGNVSINFVFVLVSIALFSFGETVLIGLGGALIQSLWKPQKPTLPPQVLFNASCLTVSAAAAYGASHGLLAALNSNSVAALISVGAGVYVVLNTGLVSLVISLAEQRSLKEVWQQCYQWTFPYFLTGAAVAGLASAAAHGNNLGLTLLIIPAMYFVYLYYRMHIVHVVLERIANVSGENNVSFVGASREH
jgi:hypothetical protein